MGIHTFLTWESLAVFIQTYLNLTSFPFSSTVTWLSQKDNRWNIKYCNDSRYVYSRNYTQNATIIGYFYARVAGIVNLSLCSRPVRRCPSVRLLLCYHTCEHDILKMNQMSTGQWHEMINFGGQEVKGQGQTRPWRPGGGVILVIPFG